MATPERSVIEAVDRMTDAPSTTELIPAYTFRVRNLSIWYGEKRAIDDVTLDIASNAVTAIIGPSGCGKSTFIRALNRMHELVPKTRVEGTVFLNGEDLFFIPALSIPRSFGAASAWFSKNRIRSPQCRSAKMSSLACD